MSLDGIEGIVDGYVHDRVDARFMEWVGQWRNASRSGGFASVRAPGEDRITRGGKCGGRMRACGLRYQGDGRGSQDRKDECPNV